jgi:hypothetical protein
MNEKPFAFVLMPFGSEFDDAYKLGIKAAAQECDVIAERVDEQIYTESILERIYRQIRNADFIIADMTGKNPNVFYEVGYAHAQGKLCTLLTQSASDIPFDLMHHRHIVYGGSVSDLKQSLVKEIEWMKMEVERLRKKVFDVELRSSLGHLNQTEYADRGEITLLFDVHNRGTRRSPEIDAIYIYTSKGWTLTQDGENCPQTQSETDPSIIRHFVKSPISRLSPGAWAQVKIKGNKVFWSRYSGSERHDSYTAAGQLFFDISTSEGTYRDSISLSIELDDDIPF